jgi:hypothetical protein
LQPLTKPVHPLRGTVRFMMVQSVYSCSAVATAAAAAAA